MMQNIMNVKDPLVILSRLQSCVPDRPSTQCASHLKSLLSHTKG